MTRPERLPESAAEQLALFEAPVPAGLKILRGFAGDIAGDVIKAVASVTDAAPFRQMQVPGGGTMSVAMSNCGAAGFTAFAPDACLINRYEPGARMGLHQDRDEVDFDAPIVSVSLGLPATFLFGGRKRSDPQARLALFHGDVVVWGGAARLAYHGIAPLQDGLHDALGRQRLNLTVRKTR